MNLGSAVFKKESLVKLLFTAFIVTLAVQSLNFMSAARLQESRKAKYNFETQKVILSAGKQKILSKPPDLQKEKIIYLATNFFGSSKWEKMFDMWPNSPQIYAYNESLKCLVTRNRGMQDSADALVFHGLDISFDNTPKQTQRKPNVPWVFFALEAPKYTRRFANSSHWATVNKLAFNWIMSYSKKSHIYYPYGKLLPNSNLTEFESKVIARKIDKFVESFQNRPVDAVWIVSNCFAASQRQNIVENMKRAGVTIDILGKCGKSFNEKEGVYKLFSRYRFYLAFENSLCDDYATEKLFTGFRYSLDFGLIPIVYGGANYSDFVPRGSYLNVLDYSNITKLANAIKAVVSDKAKIHQFYSWHFDFHLSSLVTYRHFNGWQNLCQKVWDLNSMPNVNFAPYRPNATFIADVLKGFGECRNAPKNLIRKKP